MPSSGVITDSHHYLESYLLLTIVLARIISYSFFFFPGISLFELFCIGANVVFDYSVATNKSPNQRRVRVVKGCHNLNF
jgi:hypothetical protein